MKYIIPTLCLLLGMHCLAADVSRPIALDEVLDLARERRALAQMSEDERIALIVVRSQKDKTITLKIENRHLLVCASGLAAIFEKEVLVSKKVEHFKLTLETLALDRDKAEQVIKTKLDEMGISLYDAGDSTLVLAPKKSEGA